MPKFPYDNFGLCDEQTYHSLQRAKNYFRGLVKENEISLFFEHGSNGMLNAGSCKGSCGGVAHLHWLAIDKDSITPQNLHKKIMEWEFVTSEPLAFDRENLYEFTTTGGYILFEFDSGDNFYYPVEMLPSQFIQQVITSLLEPTKQHIEWQQNYKTPECIARFRQGIIEYGQGLELDFDIDE